MDQESVGECVDMREFLRDSETGGLVVKEVVPMPETIKYT